MSSFIAEIKKIESVQTLHRVELTCKGEPLTLVSLELDTKVQEGRSVQLYIKPSNIILSRSKHQDLSSANQLPCTITSIKEGKILSNVKLNFSGIDLEAIVAATSVQKLQLDEAQEVYALINESELSLSVMED
ncbi:MAG: TOBE domain-containing protein [Sulfurimonas sp.]